MWSARQGRALSKNNFRNQITHLVGTRTYTFSNLAKLLAKASPTRPGWVSRRRRRGRQLTGVQLKDENNAGDALGAGGGAFPVWF
jgi:hypothetical protein